MSLEASPSQAELFHAKVALVRAHALLSIAGSFFKSSGCWKAVQVPHTGRYKLSNDPVEVLQYVLASQPAFSRRAAEIKLLVGVFEDFRVAHGCGVAEFAAFSARLVEKAYALLPQVGTCRRFQFLEGFKVASDACIATLSSPSWDLRARFVGTEQDLIHGLANGYNGSDNPTRRHSTNLSIADLAHQASTHIARAARNQMQLVASEFVDDAAEWDLGAVMLHKVRAGHAHSVQSQVLPGVLASIQGRAVRAQLLRACRFAHQCISGHCDIGPDRKAAAPKPIRRVLLLHNSMSVEGLSHGPAHSVPGLQPPIQVRDETFTEAGRAEAIFTQLLRRLAQASVDLIICTGEADVALLHATSVTVVPHASLRTVEALSRYLGVAIDADLDQAIQLLLALAQKPSCSDTLAMMQVLRFGVDAAGEDIAFYLHITRLESETTTTKRSLERCRCPEASFLSTPISVLLVAPLDHLLDELEFQFWTTLFAVRNGARIGCLTQGGGATETALASTIRNKLGWSQSLDPVALLGFDAFASAMEEHGALARSFCPRAQGALDDIVSKRAWLRGAVSLLHRLLAADFAIP